MKKTRRIAAMVAAMALAATMAVPSVMMSASAATKETVTITSEQGTSSTKKHSYKAYKIFSGTVNENNELEGIVFAKDNGFSAFLTALKEDTTLGSDFTDVNDVAGVAAKLGTYTDNSDKAKAFAKFVATHTSLVASPVSSSTTSGSENTIPLTEDGYYVIIEDIPSTIQEDFAITSYILKQYDASEGVDITAKSTVPSVDKQVQDEVTDKDADSTDADGWGETADHAINETFQFKLIGTLTADDKYDDYAKYKMVFHDTLNKGVTYDGNVKAKVKFGSGTEKDLTIASDKITSSIDTTSKVTTLTITIDDLKTALGDGEKLSQGAVVTITYDAHLNEDAALTGKDGNSNATTAYDNVNGVYLEYSNNPNYTGSGEGDSTGKTPSDYVWVFTYTVDNVKKKDSATGDNLAGAKFKLCTTKTAGTDGAEDTYSDEIKLNKNADGSYTVAKSNDAQAVTELVSAETTGKFDIKGLDAGTYYLVETEAPSGYKVAAPIEIVISATHKEKDTTGDAAQVTMESATKGMSNTVVDTSGATLPSTGGMGTTLFVVGGAIVAVGAGVVLVSKKRAKDAE